MDDKFWELKNDPKRKKSIEDIYEILTIKKTERLYMYQYFLDEIYQDAKYELYRQIALNLSGDLALYDVKRLIYSLLTVYIDDKFSNHLIRDKALNIIFESQKEHPNSLWPTGQLINISKDASDSISVVECAYDLIEGDAKRPILKSVGAFLPGLYNIFNNIMRTAQLDQKGDSIQGWYSLSQRNKQPNSWITALTMLFIKQFCTLISFEISNRAKNFFRLKYRDVNTKWDELYDSTAVKSKLRLMFNDEDKSKRTSVRAAMLFGPPGTGKTTFARALAKKLDRQYLELTPGDFYAGGENDILPRINEIFNNLQQLKETVVFIDEIDDLVIGREKEFYDPRTLYVNTLLPRFQDIHEHSDVILIAATNHIKKVDKAISRLGRFDMII